MKRKLKKAEVSIALKILSELYPDAKAELNYTTELDLLVATILSAQCTDCLLYTSELELNNLILYIYFAKNNSSPTILT